MKIEKIKKRNADPASLEARTVQTHKDLIAAEEALEAAKVDLKLKTLAYLQAVSAWRSQTRYTNFVAEMTRALKISKSTADNHLRAAGVAERTGLLDAQHSHRMPQLIALELIGRMCNSRDAGKRKYAQHLEDRIRVGKSIPRTSELKRAASGELANDLHIDAKDLDPVPATVGAFNLLRTLAIAGDDQARNSITDLISAIERGGEVRIRFSGTVKVNIAEPLRQELLDLLRGGLDGTKETAGEGKENIPAALTGMDAIKATVATAVAAPMEKDDAPAVVGKEIPADAVDW